MKVKKLDYHRNGISGLGFWVGIVEEEGRDHLVVRFPDVDTQSDGVVCAAFNIKSICRGDIEDSYRGDHFHEAMDAAISAHHEERSRQWHIRITQKDAKRLKAIKGGTR